MIHAGGRGAARALRPYRFDHEFEIELSSLCEIERRLHPLVFCRRLLEAHQHEVHQAMGGPRSRLLPPGQSVSFGRPAHRRRQAPPLCRRACGPWGPHYGPAGPSITRRMGLKKARPGGRAHWLRNTIGIVTRPALNQPRNPPMSCCVIIDLQPVPHPGRGPGSTGKPSHGNCNCSIRAMFKFEEKPLKTSGMQSARRHP
jgi:hypothetical protein